MVGQVYEWLAVFTTLDEDGDEKSSEIIDSGRLLAKSRDVALFTAAREIDAKYPAAQVQMIVLPVTERVQYGGLPYTISNTASTLPTQSGAGSWTNLAQIQGSLT